MVALVTNVLLGLADVVSARLLLRGRDPARALLVLAAATLGVCLLGRGLGWGKFAILQVLAWALFVHAPVVFCAAAVTGTPRIRALSVTSALLLALVGVEAFMLGPRRLEVNTVPLPGPPLRIALVADLQTDAVGAYERAAIEAVAAAEPDLVLFAGDYLQIRDDAAYAREAASLRDALAVLQPRLGAFAVRGDVDRDDWPALFEGTAITPVTTSRTFDLGPLSITALAPHDAASARPPVPPRDGFHVVLAHRPDFALTRPDADLLVAGHVHGGQVRLPWISADLRPTLLPLMTLSNVPRAWAAGVTALPWGGHLVVSRGVGMERYDAPRLRFLCPPEVVILELDRR